MAIEQDQFVEEGQLRAVCIKCGAEKFEPFYRCESCGADPHGDDLLKSTYLSVYRYADNHDAALSYSRQLAATQTAIRNGNAVAYDSSELDRLRSELNALTTPGHQSGLLGKFLVILLIAGVVGLAIGYFL